MISNILEIDQIEIHAWHSLKFKLAYIKFEVAGKRLTGTVDLLVQKSKNSDSLSPVNNVFGDDGMSANPNLIIEEIIKTTAVNLYIFILAW